MKKTIIAYIQDNLLDSNEEPLQAEDDLLTSGLIDSINVMKLISFIEEKFEVTIPPEDMTIEYFMTVENIVEYLESRKVAA